jgi:arginine/ornithine N-succinyltransferase beta subunit
MITKGKLEVNKDGVIIAPEVAEAIKVKAGDMVRYVL